jgi:hypothetical protein
MKRTLLATTLVLLLWGMPALAGPAPCGTTDTDGDTVPDCADNCSDVPNTAQDDTDGDLCGNACDADYNNSGDVTFGDYFEFATAFGTNDEEMCHTGTIPGCTVTFAQYFFFATAFGGIPGPSGTTPGTTACP